MSQSLTATHNVKKSHTYNIYNQLKNKEVIKLAKTGTMIALVISSYKTMKRVRLFEHRQIFIFATTSATARKENGEKNEITK